VVVSLADALTMLRRERLGGPASSWARASDGQAEGAPSLESQLGAHRGDEPAGSEPLISLIPDGHPGATGTLHGSLARERGQRRRGLGS
jgi:hypothetical protein